MNTTFFLKGNENIISQTSIKDDLVRYCSLIKMADMGSAAFSIEACKLHEKLMCKMSIDHQSESARTIFALILDAFKVSYKHHHDDCIAIVMMTDQSWQSEVVIGTKASYVRTEPTHMVHNYNLWIIENKDLRMWEYELNNYFYQGESNAPGMCVGYEGQLNDGVLLGKAEYREGSCNGSSGYYFPTASIAPEMEAKIRKMGLIPVLCETGSYHENWYFVRGIYPEKYSQYKRWEEGED